MTRYQLSYYSRYYYSKNFDFKIFGPEKPQVSKNALKIVIIIIIMTLLKCQNIVLSWG